MSRIRNPGQKKQKKKEQNKSKIYHIYVKQESELYPGMAGFYGYSAAYDLGKLEHLKSYGVNTERL